MNSQRQDNMTIEIKRTLAKFVNETQKRLFFFYQRERPEFHIPPQVEVHMMENNMACVTHHTVATNHHYTMCFINMNTGDIHKPLTLKEFEEMPLGNILEEGEQFIGRDGNFWIPRKGHWPAGKTNVIRNPRSFQNRPFAGLDKQIENTMPVDERQPLHLASEYDNTYGRGNR